MLKKLVALVAVMLATAGFSQEPDWQQEMFSKGPYVCSINVFNGEEALPEQLIMAVVDFRAEPYYVPISQTGESTKLPLTFLNKANRKTSFYIADENEGTGIFTFNLAKKTSTDEGKTTVNVFLELTLLLLEDDEFRAEGWCQLAPKLD